jgi:GT2 family glycosyltransferase
MTTKAISNAVNFLKADVFELSAGESHYELGGAYRFSLDAGGVEIELVNSETLWRTIIYVKAGLELVLFLPHARYQLYVAPLGGGAGPVRVGRMTGVARLGFYLTKMFSVLRRPPHEAFQAIKVFWRRNRSGLPTAAQPGRQAASVIAQTDREILQPAPADAPRAAVSIIIPTKERLDLLRACINSLALLEDARFEVIIVDNGASHPDMLAYLAGLGQRDNVRVLRRDIPFNFSQLCNDGAQLAIHPLLLFLNDDIEALDGNWLGAMQGFAAREDTGVVGARLLYPSGTLQHGGIASNLVPGPGHPWRNVPRDIWQTEPLLAEAGEVDAVTGACLMIRKAGFEAIGGFDADAFAVTLNDVDLCLRVRERGLKVVYVPQATLLHKEGQTRRADDHPEEALRYRGELAAFYRRHKMAARVSVFYPRGLRRDGDAGLAI